MQGLFTAMVIWFGIFIIFFVTLTKFIYICVWKGMRQINDDFWARIAILEAILLSFLVVYPYMICGTPSPEVSMY